MENGKEHENRQLAMSRLSHEGRKYFKFIEFDENERLVTEIRKHFVGLLIILLTGAFVILAMLVIIGFAAAVNTDSLVGVEDTSGVKALLVVLGFLLIIGSAIATFIAAFLFQSNVIYVTNEKIAQVLYISLFNRKISQLSIGDVQDVTVTQKGILAHAFNYGTLVIETAGEQQNYTFTYVPNPYEASKLIVGSHEKNLVQYGN